MLCAELPTNDPELAALAQKVQRGDPDRAPVHEGASKWEFSTSYSAGYLVLRKTKEFAQLSLRPFLPTLLRIFRCSQDVQWWYSGAPLLRYVTGYTFKYSEAWDAAWVDTAGSSWAAALSVARYWKPGACEQVMTLSHGGVSITNVQSITYRPTL